MVKVCHVTSVHSTYDERIFHKECVSLANNGYEVAIVGPGECRVDRGVTIFGIGDKPASRLKRMLSFTRKIYKKAIALDCDIYHFHDPELLHYANKAKKRGKIVIFDSHEDVPAQLEDKDYLPKHLKKFAVRYYTNLEKKVLSRLDAVITVSPHIIDRLSKLCQNAIMVTNYPRLDHRDCSFSEKKDVFNAVCFTGAINEGWHHTNIARALRLLDGVQYHLYGKAEDGYIAELTEIAGVDKVFYKGYIEHSKILATQANYVAGMCLWEYCANAGGKIGTLGNTKMFEYMLAGIPIICTDFSLWKKIVDKHHCGIYVSPDNIEEIAKAIEYYKENREIALVHGKNGRNAVIHEYNWDNEEKKLLKLYHILKS